jgi:large subunit ribosomal protein L32e
MKIRKRPKFWRQAASGLKRLKKKWRRPRGYHSKLRRHEKSKGSIPQPGYGTPANLRFLHPSGFREILVFNPNDIQKLNPSTDAAKISHSVGKRKRQDIAKKAAELKVKVLNP